MSLDKLSPPPWLQALVASLGGFGLFAAAFLDASVLSLPVINDILVIRLSIQNPTAMPFYATMATLGSLAGCLFLYYLAKKGGEVMFRKRVGPRAARVRAWVERNAFLSIAVPSILPPPMPFKAFVLAAGVFQMPMRIFIVALIIGRGFRYFAEGILAVRYGADATRFLLENKLEFTLIIVGLLVASYLVTRFIFRATHHEPQPPATPQP
jgi:membrane protein YqaA with SNARE-associated domain